MTRHSFIWSLLAMVLAPLGLRIPERRPSLARFEEQLKFQRAKDAFEARADVWVHYGNGGRVHFDSLSAAIDTVEASGKDIVYVYPA